MAEMTEQAVHKSDRWIPWSIVAFFVVVAILDGIFVYLATSSHTGVVTKHAYEEGLNYNDTVAEAEAQASLGWTSDIEIVAVGDKDQLVFRLADANGAAIEGAMARAEFIRPTQEGMDFGMPLEQNGAGQYVATVAFPRAGQWDVRVFVQWKQKRYQQTKRVVVAK